MKSSKFDIAFVGNAIVDIISHTSDENLNKLQIQKGSMQLIDFEKSENLLKIIENTTIISGGSAANSAVGFSSFGGKSYFIGQIGSDKFGNLFSKNINESGVFFQKNINTIEEKTSKRTGF